MGKPRRESKMINGTECWGCCLCKTFKPTKKFYVFEGKPVSRCIPCMRVSNKVYRTAYYKRHPKLKKERRRKPGSVEQEIFYARTVSDLGL